MNINVSVWTLTCPTVFNKQIAFKNANAMCRSFVEDGADVPSAAFCLLGMWTRLRIFHQYHYSFGSIWTCKCIFLCSLTTGIKAVKISFKRYVYLLFAGHTRIDIIKTNLWWPRKANSMSFTFFPDTFEEGKTADALGSIPLSFWIAF